MTTLACDAVVACSGISGGWAAKELTMKIASGIAHTRVSRRHVQATGL